jgi:hypothetical protein
MPVILFISYDVSDKKNLPLRKLCETYVQIDIYLSDFRAYDWAFGRFLRNPS